MTRVNAGGSHTVVCVMIIKEQWLYSFLFWSLVIYFTLKQFIVTEPHLKLLTTRVWDCNMP